MRRMSFNTGFSFIDLHQPHQSCQPTSPEASTSGLLDTRQIMAREIELDELFAYLDQLELNERLEQEQVDVSLGLWRTDADGEVASEAGTSRNNVQYPTLSSGIREGMIREKGGIIRGSEEGTAESVIDPQQRATSGKHFPTQPDTPDLTSFHRA